MSIPRFVRLEHVSLHRCYLANPPVNGGWHMTMMESYKLVHAILRQVMRSWALQGPLNLLELPEELAQPEKP
jgi:hypothetical protein